jgi:methionine-rich copper-binding protein CopC
MRSHILLQGFLAVLLAAWPGEADARALHMIDSIPMRGATIDGRNAQYVIHLDGLVDHVSSRLEIMQGGHVVRRLTLLGDSAPDVLFSTGPALPAGNYVLNWYARSSADGAVTEGEVPFTVAP